MCVPAMGRCWAASAAEDGEATDAAASSCCAAAGTQLLQLPAVRAWRAGAAAVRAERRLTHRETLVPV